MHAGACLFSQTSRGQMLTCAAAEQYADREYWDKRYGEAAGFFEWYHGYDALRELLDAHLSRSCPVLQVLLRPCSLTS